MFARFERGKDFVISTQGRLQPPAERARTVGAPQKVTALREERKGFFRGLSLVFVGNSLWLVILLAPTTQHALRVLA